MIDYRDAYDRLEELVTHIDGACPKGEIKPFFDYLIQEYFTNDSPAISREMYEITGMCEDDTLEVLYGHEAVAVVESIVETTRFWLPAYGALGFSQFLLDVRTLNGARVLLEMQENVFKRVTKNCRITDIGWF